MDIRRVQITGGSSFTISLPKEWVRSQSIEKNSPVGLDIQSDGTLMVYPKVDSGKVERVKIFEIENFEQDLTFRMLIGAYIMGYSTIEIRSKPGIPSSVMDSAMEFTQRAIGPEIIEESENRVIIKDLLNPSKMPFEKTLERMYIIVRYMHNDTVSSIVNDMPNLVEDISSRDREVDRLNWLMAHQYNIINSSNLSHSMNISREKAEFYFVAGRIVERIGDHAVQISKNSELFRLDDNTKELKDSISSASNFAIEMFDRSMNAWYNRDIESANDTVESSDRLWKYCEKVDQLSLGFDRDVAIAIGRIADSIRRTGDYSTDISENVINYLIRDL